MHTDQGVGLVEMDFLSKSRCMRANKGIHTHAPYTHVSKNIPAHIHSHPHLDSPRLLTHHDTLPSIEEEG